MDGQTLEREFAVRAFAPCLPVLFRGFETPDARDAKAEKVMGRVHYIQRRRGTRAGLNMSPAPFFHL